MTFCHRVKNEITHNKSMINHARKAFLYGLLLCGKSFSTETVSLCTEHKGVSRLYSRLIFSTIGIDTSVTTREFPTNLERNTYVSTVDSQDDREKILAFYGYPTAHNTEALHIHFDLLENSEDKFAFIAGAFLACSNLSNPEKDYHLEFVFHEESLAQDMLSLLEGLDLKVNQSTRRGHALIYSKDSKSIEDILTMIGATNSVMDIINIKIYRDVRNKVNRRTNCETSNIEKMVTAATEQSADIRYLQQVGLFDTLEPALKETALIRLKNPDLSLRELSELMGISRSGINHRLKKISDITQKAKTMD